MTRRVRTGSVYVFDPVPIDASARHLLHVERGIFVRVVNLPGCPHPNTMGHCFVEGAVTNEFIGLVCCNSLRDVSAPDRRSLIRQGTITPRRARRCRTS